MFALFLVAVVIVVIIPAFLLIITDSLTVWFAAVFLTAASLAMYISSNPPPLR